MRSRHVETFEGIRCKGCNTPFPDLPEFKAHLNDDNNCPGGDES